MSINFATLQALDIPEGKVVEIKDAGGRVIWAVQSGGGAVILEVKKITSDTYAGETTYTGESFILLDIYPKTNGTVSVTYGGLTKTITDTSGAEEPNAQQVFFGTFNGVSDSVETPSSGELTIDGDYYAFACGSYSENNKITGATYCMCITEVLDFGKITDIAPYSFSNGTGTASVSNGELPNGILTIGDHAFYGTAVVSVTIPNTVTNIGNKAFCYCRALKTVNMLGILPPKLTPSVNGAGDVWYDNFSDAQSVSEQASTSATIVVPKGCGNTYKTAEGWNTFASKIVEES